MPPASRSGMIPLPFCRITLSLLPVLALAGCGGGGASPNPSSSGPITVDNSLSRSDFFDSDDNRYYDIYVCDAQYTGTATVGMESDEVDSYLLIYRKNSSGDYDLIAQDDDSGSGNDAFTEFSVDRGDTYRIIATSSGSEERGDYDLHLSEELGRPARVLPDDARVAQSLKTFKLPVIPAKPKP